MVVSIGQQGANLRVEVRDEGTGLSTENQAKLFSSVIQFHAKAQQGGGGSGMGLWISKKLTDMHGGEIGVFSEGEGRGSMFYFTVPVCDAEAALAYRERRAAESAIAEVAAAAEFRAAESLRVLICDDSVLNRKMLMRLFESHSHQVWEAGDGDVAVELVQQSIDAGEADRYKVITMDNVSVCLCELFDLLVALLTLLYCRPWCGCKAPRRRSASERWGTKATSSESLEI